ncbi:MAG: hypothetical protein JWO22_3464 [Frankiales bacterium]|nr:hypothetical protein [Frankiales bacterium]
MKRLAVAACLLLGLAVPAHGSPPPREQFLHAAGGHVVDESGRTVILRGVNVNGLVDYWTPSLNPPYPTGPAGYASGRCPADSALTTAVPLCERDLDQIAAVGFDVVRLPASWSLLEPAKGRLDPVPVDRIAQVVGWARARGIRVVIDLHQDAWSKYVFAPKGTVCPPGSTAMDGGDGAPAWASVAVTPACAPGGTRELEPPVQEAAQRFWLDENGLQDEYAKVVVSLARRFHDDPTVAGYELMNEPQPGLAPGVMDSTELMQFHGRVVNAVVAAVPHFRQLFFVEPAGTRNVTGARTFVLPWSTYSSYPNVVYAPHVYTGVFTADRTLLLGAAGNLQTFDADYDAAVGDAQALGLPLWVGEFGNDPADDKAILAQHYAHQDALAVGGALWVWKEHGRWSAQATPGRALRISTAYPIATAGTLDAFSSDPFTGAVSVRARSPKGSTSVVALPAPFTRKPVVTGGAVRVVGHRAYVTARGGPWTLRV